MYHIINQIIYLLGIINFNTYLYVFGQKLKSLTFREVRFIFFLWDQGSISMCLGAIRVGLDLTQISGLGST
jgi:uncharacterized membrane protein